MVHVGVVMKWIVLTAHEINPRAHTHLLACFHHFEGFVEEYFAGQGVIDDLDDAVGKGEPSSGGVLLHADTTAEGQFDDYAASQSI